MCWVWGAAVGESAPLLTSGSKRQNGNFLAPKVCAEIRQPIVHASSQKKEFLLFVTIGYS